MTEAEKIAPETLDAIAEWLRAADRIELMKTYRQDERGLTRIGWMLNASSGEVSEMGYDRS